MFKAQLDKSDLYEVYIIHDRDSPHVRMNFITSADGAATINGRSGGLGSETDQNLMKVMRAMSDVVLVGAGTVRAEGYGSLGLKAPEIEWRKNRHLPETPRIAIVTNSADLDPESSVFMKAKTPPIIITNSRANADHLAAVSDVFIAGEKEVDTRAAITLLKDMGLLQILCEGGPHLFGSLLDADLVHEVCLTVSPTFTAGNAERIAVSGFEHGHKFTLQSVLHDEDSMLYLKYKRFFDS